MERWFLLFSFPEVLGYCGRKLDCDGLRVGLRLLTEVCIVSVVTGLHGARFFGYDSMLLASETISGHVSGREQLQHWGLLTAGVRSLQSNPSLKSPVFSREPGARGACGKAFESLLHRFYSWRGSHPTWARWQACRVPVSLRAFRRCPTMLSSPQPPGPHLGSPARLLTPLTGQSELRDQEREGHRGPLSPQPSQQPCRLCACSCALLCHVPVGRAVVGKLKT